MVKTDIPVREGENNDDWFRCSRFYTLGDSWYFTTREGVDFGPFTSRDEAEQALKSFIQPNEGDPATD